MSDDLFAPVALADVTAPRHWGVKFLFRHLTERFDYIIQIFEQPTGWCVALWYRFEAKSPEQLGVSGELAHPGWTLDDVSLRRACEMRETAARAVRGAGHALAVVFYPGSGWRAAVKKSRAHSSVREPGAA